MKHYLSILFLAFVLISCGDDDSPAPEQGMLSKIIGDKIYTVIQGHEQTGAPGQFLEKDIKLIVRNFDGTIVHSDLEFQLSDESGLLNNSGSYYYSDTITLRWKLGCEATKQSIKVRALNICGIAKSECIDVDVFEITADATAKISTGWYTPCVPQFDNSYRITLVNDKNIAIISYDQLITTNDLISSDWNDSRPNFSFDYGRFELLSSGEIFFSGSSNQAIFSNSGGWRNIDIPFSAYYNDVHIEVTDNGTYFLIEEYNNTLYKSNDGVNWSIYLNLSDITEGNSYNVQAMVVDSNRICFVMYNGYVVEIDALDNDYAVHYIGNNSWGYSGYGYYDTELLGNKLFIKNTYDEDIHVVDLSNNKEEIFNSSYGYNIFKSAGQILMINDPSEVLVWQGAGFTSKNYPSPDPYPYSSFIGIYKGAPIVIGYDGTIFYYIE